MTARVVCATRALANQLGYVDDYLAAPLQTQGDDLIAWDLWLQRWLAVLRVRLGGQPAVPKLPPAFFWRRLTFFIDSILTIMIPRTVYFDSVLAAHQRTHKAVVVLGAGLDTRALRLPRSPGVRFFEIDAPGMIRAKQHMLARIGIDCALNGGVTHVPVVFSGQNWLDELIKAGFDRTQPAVFLAEGLLNYLDDDTVVGTLKAIASCASGTLLALTTRLGAATASAVERESMRRLARLGEPHKFVLPEGTHTEFFASHNFDVLEFTEYPAMVETFVPPAIKAVHAEASGFKRYAMALVRVR